MKTSNRTITEKKICSLQNTGSVRIFDETLRITPNRRKAAYLAQEGEKGFLIVNGEVIGSRYYLLTEMCLSLDSKHFSYAAQREKYSKWCVVVDGIGGKGYIQIGSPSFSFSPDSQRYGYTAFDGKKWFVVVDNIEGHKYDNIKFGPNFSPDSKRVAYPGFTKTKTGFLSAEKSWRIVVDGEEMKDYADVTTCIFSPNSRRIAYWAKKKDSLNWIIVVDEIEGNEYRGGDNLIFSPDSKKFAFSAYNKDNVKHFAILNDRKGKEYDKIQHFFFSPNSTHFGYCALEKKKVFLVVDGEEGKKYDELFFATLTRPGIQVIFYEVFSPDSQHMIYGAREGKKSFVVVDGEEGNRFDDLVGGLVFSPNSNRVGYVVKEKKKYLAIIDGVSGKPYKQIFQETLGFSPDSQHVIYVAFDRGGWFTVVDGVEGNRYDTIYCTEVENPFFNSSKDLNYIAKKGNDLFLVEEFLD